MKNQKTTLPLSHQVTNIKDEFNNKVEKLNMLGRSKTIEWNQRRRFGNI